MYHFRDTHSLSTIHQRIVTSANVGWRDILLLCGVKGFWLLNPFLLYRISQCFSASMVGIQHLLWNVQSYTVHVQFVLLHRILVILLSNKQSLLGFTSTKWKKAFVFPFQLTIVYQLNLKRVFLIICTRNTDHLFMNDGTVTHVHRESPTIIRGTALYAQLLQHV